MGQAATCKCVAQRVVLYERPHHHHGAREHHGKADAHLIENDARDDEEEHEHIEEELRATVDAKGCGIPPHLRGEHRL